MSDKLKAKIHELKESASDPFVNKAWLDKDVLQILNALEVAVNCLNEYSIDCASGVSIYASETLEKIEQILCGGME